METIIASVLLPALIDMFKSGVSAASRRWVGLSVDDQIKLGEHEIGKLESVAKLDNPYGTPSQWVVDLRASFRYLAAGILIVGGLCVAGLGAYAKDQGLMLAGLEAAGAPFGFIFGERMWANFTGRMK
jgi:hypothetical protein